jgi:hypothetical protein
MALDGMAVLLPAARWWAALDDVRIPDEINVTLHSLPLVFPK